MKNIIMVGCVLAMNLGTAQAAMSLSRDASYEEKLRWAAAPSEPITPKRFLRWISQLSGHTNAFARPSNTEFQPIVNVQNDKVRVIASIAYKF